MQRKMIKWRDEGSMWNFEHRADLLHVEERYSNGDLGNAEVFYDKAIAAAKAHKFLDEETLACVLAANFFFNIDKYVQGESSRSRWCWRRWWKWHQPSG